MLNVGPLSMVLNLLDLMTVVASVLNRFFFTIWSKDIGSSLSLTLTGMCHCLVLGLGRALRQKAVFLKLN